MKRTGSVVVGGRRRDYHRLFQDRTVEDGRVRSTGPAEPPSAQAAWS
jgi:hypothetical protein